MSELGDYLGRAGALGFRLGELDCCTFMADWLMRRGFPDVMADRRGAYASAREFRRLLMAEGGLVASCHRRFTSAGLGVTAAARAGDVAVLMLPRAHRAGYRATGAIAVSPSHFAIVAGGARMVLMRSAAVVKIWTYHA